MSDHFQWLVIAVTFINIALLVRELLRSR